MAGLVLKLSPGERILINGVVMENGERKATLRIKTPNASILRLRDAMHPEEANTPVKRAYFTAQNCVAGSADPDVGAQELGQQLEALAHAFDGTQHAQTIAQAVENLDKRNFYAAMRALQPLIEVEKELLPPEAKPAPDASGTNGR